MAGPDLSVVMAAVDFDTVTIAVLGVAAAIIVVYVYRRGSMFVLDAVSGRPVSRWMIEAEECEERRQRINAEWVAANPVQMAEMRQRARSEATAALASGKFAPGSLIAQAYRESLERNS
ncbi:MAG: hypothetical protein RugAbin2_01533 [Rugosibacter sp.]|nr:hypothetical protein [Rugosibacter sp.]